jgi:hypothetical protein
VEGKNYGSIKAVILKKYSLVPVMKGRFIIPVFVDVT